MSGLHRKDVIQTNSSGSQGRSIPLKVCVDCGGVWKSTHYCPAEFEKCEFCGKTGHYSRFCRFSDSQTRKNDSKNNDQTHQGKGEQCKQTFKDDDKENSKWEQSYFCENNDCDNGTQRKHSSTKENDDNCGNTKSRDTAYSFPGGDQPVYSKKTRYSINFAGQSRYNPQPEANNSGVGYTSMPRTKYESIELKKKLAKQFYTQGKYEAALSHYSRLTELCPNDALIFNNKCACYMMLGQYENASAEAVKAINLNPSLIKAHCRLIKCGLLIGNTSSVELSVSKLSQLDPNNETLQFARERLDKLKNHLEEENIAVNNENYQQALKMAKNCLRISPQSLPFKLKKAEYLALVNNYDESTKLVDEIMQKDPRNIKAKYIRGLILYYNESFNRSVDHFREILHLDPNHAKSLVIYKKAKVISETFDKSDGAFNSGNYATAHYLDSSVLSVDFQNTRLRTMAYNRMGDSSFHMKNYQQAIDEFSEAIKMNCKSTLALKRRGESYMQLKNYEEAIADFSRVCNLKIDAHCQKLLQDAEKALASVTRSSYEILGVNTNTSIEEIKQAYKDKAMIHHPDRHSNDTIEQKQMHERKFQSITLAYRNLLAKFSG